jgi:DNA-binding NarL/FixJ family response regulator
MLVDLRLPDTSGIDVVRELKISGVSALTLMVIMTAFPALDSSFDAGTAGADGYVDGLLSGDDVVSVVTQALEGVLPVRHSAGRVSTDTAETVEGRLIDYRVQQTGQLR